MNLTLNLVSSVCWEVIAKQTIPVNVETLPLFKLLSDAVYDFSPAVARQNPRMYWRYSRENFLEITDYFSFGAFLSLAAEPDLFLVLKDADRFYANTEKFFAILDLMELKRVKEANRNKYDLKSEADEIEEQIQKCQRALASNSSFLSASEVNDDKDILRFALRNMPMGRCYTADICSGYSLIDCVRKGWSKSKKMLAPLPDETIERKSKKDKAKPADHKESKKSKKPKAKNK